MSRGAVGQVFLTLALFLLTSAGYALARDLTFDERVAAQEAIERVYYSHQIGTTKPFEEAVPREVIERKVHDYIRQSVALQEFWRTPVTGEMLRKELERIAKSSRMPERLLEISAALNNDVFLLEECLARPALVDRLARNFFSSDQRIHSATRAEAEELHRQLAYGELSVLSENPYRTIVEITSGTSGQPPAHIRGRPQISSVHEGDARSLQLGPDEFREWRTAVPRQVGQISPLKEVRDSFVTHVVLSESLMRFSLASYVIAKTSWDVWWESNQGRFAEEKLTSSASMSEVPFLPDLAGGNQSCVTGDTWDNGILDDLPQTRSGHSAVWTGSEMILWGGTNVGGNRYDPTIDTWKSISEVNAPSGRSGHTAVWTGSRMIIWGGSRYTDHYIYENTGGKYDPVTDSWESMSTLNAPTGREAHTAVWSGDQMIIWGGYRGGFLDSGGGYDPIEDRWSTVAAIGAPSARYHHTAVWTGEAMIVWGGEIRGWFANTGGVYDPRSNTWANVSTASAPTERALHTAVWTGDRMVIWGGGYGESGPSNTGGRYDPLTDSWTPTSVVNAPFRRTRHNAVWTGRQMLIWGGLACTDVCFTTDTGAQYDPVDDKWAEISTVNAPPRQWSYTAVWTGELMLIWGGDPASGRRYDPKANSWTPISIGTAPEPTNSATSVWTGNVMIVWGGEELGYTYVSKNTGGRYDPTLDTWSPTSITGAPAARTSHTAIWTGSRMVVWGGGSRQSNGVQNTGGQYDPITDTWTPMSTTSAGAARGSHTAVWTGSEMIVWGGYTSGISNSGARYNPLTDVWLPMSMANAPGERYGHAAVWTGKEMIVWGGWGSPINLNTGGRYDPVLDTWVRTSMAGVPPGRLAPVAVWTGTLMVVWGGYDGQDVNTGGRYNPSSDTWMPTTPTGAPPKSLYNTAVWSGREMLVWEGPGQQGGRYDPGADKWEPISTVNAALRRVFHTAVWTGTYMIVWGGNELGGRYAPDPIAVPPRADAGPDQVLECSGPNGTAVTLSGGGTGCGDTDSLSYTWRGPFPEGGGMIDGPTPTVNVPLGTSSLNLSVEDAQGQIATDTVTITVRDTSPPTLTCPTVLPTECSSSAGTPVTLPTAQFADVCDAQPVLHYSQGSEGTDFSGVFQLGQTEVGITASDASGNMTSCAFPVIVQDTTPPQITFSLNSASLWPPNHRMVDVEAQVAANDACSSPSFTLASIASTEPDDVPAPGDGNTSSDIQGADPGTPDSIFQLRAERDGNGTGRTYTVTYTAVDGSGNSSQAHAFVVVPHDLGGTTEPLDLSVQEALTGTRLSWNAVAGATFYTVIRGNVRSLQLAGDFIDLGAVSCVRPSSALTSTSGQEDDEIPARGEAFFYLASYNDGRDSGYGSASAAKPRISQASHEGFP